MNAEWWQRGVIYQVYPRSFQDSDGDGVGDLRGIIDRLDHLQWLGVDAIWVSPIFPSPMADFGYDVADYTDVDSTFGTLADLDALVTEAHRRGMRLLLDLVPNHTSDRHPWFVESRSSRGARRRDWYIWRDPRPDGSPPNGWLSMFGGSAWQWDEASGQYYFHSFLPEQPDLDWTNPQVREAMCDVMRFWFRRGVDGFRIDVVTLLAKDHELRPSAPDKPLDPTIATDPARSPRVLARQVWGDTPEIHPIIADLRAVADEFDQRVLIGEVWLPPKRLVAYYGRDLAGLHMPFNFQLITLPWDAAQIHRAIVRYEELLPAGAWPNWVLGNHDKERILSRVGAAQARVAAMLLLTLRGTPTLYYGDEIGMFDVPVPAGRQLDPQGLHGGESRDPFRTPMRWVPGQTAGFTSGQPWLPVGPAVAEINVAAQGDDPGSMLSLYRRLLELRRRERALHLGEWRDLGVAGAVLAYLRTDGNRQFLVALNLGSEPAALPVAARGRRGTTIVATDHRREGEPFDGLSPLAADEGLVVLLD